MAAVPESVARQAELRRRDGNACFKKTRLGAAIDCYTELRRRDGNACFKKTRLGAAIDCYTEAKTLCPNVAVYWMNRGLCYFKRKEWTKVEEDSRKGLELDDSLVKNMVCIVIWGHYMLGCALLEKEEYAPAIKEFEKALNLLWAANPRDKMVEEIWQVLSKAKYLDWEKSSSEQVWRLQNLKEACENALQEHRFLSGSLLEDSEGTANHYSEQLKLLSEVFDKATLADRPTDVPDYLCCQITFEIFRDPVITPSGVTYERAVLLEHLRKVGNFDPVT